LRFHLIKSQTDSADKLRLTDPAKLTMELICVVFGSKCVSEDGDGWGQSQTSDTGDGYEWGYGFSINGNGRGHA
jgi:hypothetical protein